MTITKEQHMEKGEEKVFIPKNVEEQIKELQKTIESIKQYVSAHRTNHSVQLYELHDKVTKLTKKVKQLEKKINSK